MTTPASNIFTKVIYIPEVTFDVLPATPTMIDIPFVDCSLSPDITKVTDATIQGDTQHRYQVPTTQKVSGTISGEVSHTNADYLFSGILYSTWSSNVVKVGTTQVSYSIEVGHPDIGQYFLYSGCVLDKVAFTFSPAGLVTYKADVLGASFTQATVTNAGTTTAAINSAPLSTVTATIDFNGSPVAYITGATINFDRKSTEVYALGSSAPKSIVTSFFEATGSLDLLIEDATTWTDFTANTACAIAWTLTDGTNTYVISLPQLYLDTFTTSVTSSGPVTAKANFTAVYNTAAASAVVITRSS